MNEVAKAETYEDRLYKKIREDIGALMTDEELKKLVEQAIEREFFTPRHVRRGYETIQVRSQLVEIVHELLGPKVREAADAWLAANPDRVEVALKEAMANGIASAVIRSFDGMLSSAFSQLGYNLENSIRTALQR